MKPVYRAFFDFDDTYKWVIEKGYSHGYYYPNRDTYIRFSHRTDVHYSWSVPTSEIYDTLEEAREYAVSNIHQEIQNLYEDIIRIKTEEV